MPGGSSNKQQTSTSSQPWAAAQPALMQSLAGAQGVYNAPELFRPYQGSTVVPFSDETKKGMAWSGSVADASQQALNENYGRIAQNAALGGLNSTQQGVVDRLTKQATGSFDPNANPGFQSVLKQATDSAGNAVDMGASAAGRYGSGIHQGNVAREVGNVAGQLTSSEYNDFKNRQDAANSGLFNAGQQQYQNILGNTSALSDAYTARQAPSMDLMRLGGMNEDMATRQMNDQLRIWQGNRDAPKNQVEWLQAIGSGAGSLGGSGSTTAQGPKANPFGQVAGGLLGLNSLFGGF